MTDKLITSSLLRDLPSGLTGPIAAAIYNGRYYIVDENGKLWEGVRDVAAETKERK